MNDVMARPAVNLIGVPILSVKVIGARIAVDRKILWVPIRISRAKVDAQVARAVTTDDHVIAFASKT